LQGQLQSLVTESHVQTASGEHEPVIGGFYTDDGESGNGPNTYILSNTSHAGGQILTWTNANQSQMPLFVRAGAVIPMLPTDVRTLCDANYVNDPAVSTRGDDLLFQVYPAGASSFTVFDGTQAQCQGDASGGRVTITATARNVAIRILGNAPVTVKRNGEPLPLCSGARSLGLALRCGDGLHRGEFLPSGGVSTIEY
jgi:hypothetical protein